MVRLLYLIWRKSSGSKPIRGVFFSNVVLLLLESNPCNFISKLGKLLCLLFMCIISIPISMWQWIYEQWALNYNIIHNWYSFTCLLQELKLQFVCVTCICFNGFTMKFCWFQINNMHMIRSMYSCTQPTFIVPGYIISSNTVANFQVSVIVQCLCDSCKHSNRYAKKYVFSSSLFVGCSASHR